MCGIACIVNYNLDLPDEVLRTFTEVVKHRGPDGFGMKLFSQDTIKPVENNNWLVGMGHQRLSILDLSDAGAQPMVSADGNYVIIYNGEVYNYLELRKELEAEGLQFQSDCDTEVVLQAYSHWGENCVNRFNGMWAFVLLDKRKRQLFISRDRIGIKPLYYCLDNDRLAISSEIKQFFTLPDFDRKVNKKACFSYLLTGYEIAPETFFADVMAFPPGCRATVRLDEPEKIKPETFWNADDIKPQTFDGEELIQRIKNCFSQAVKLRLRSDVPVGGCLSGGLDSSAIFVEMKKNLPESRFSAFSACFEEKAIDERPFIHQVAQVTGSEKIEVFPDSNDLVDDLGAFLTQHDEPVGSLSMYAQYRVMKAARSNEVPVLLDGQGGDELFSGYWPSYLLMMNRLKKEWRFGSLAWHLIGALMPGGNGEIFPQAFTHFGEYRRRASSSVPFELKQDEVLKELETTSWHSDAQKLSPWEYRKAEIFQVHLPRLLKWEDRNSMAFSIESRVPFLDVNLVELLLSVPPEKNMKKGWTKYLFRKAMDGVLPRKICWRKDKIGFETPQNKWMKSGKLNQHLVSWAETPEHPVAEFVKNDFNQTRTLLKTGNFNAIAMFRLFCLDYWLKNIVG